MYMYTQEHRHIHMYDTTTDRNLHTLRHKQTYILSTLEKTWTKTVTEYPLSKMSLGSLANTSVTSIPLPILPFHYIWLSIISQWLSSVKCQKLPRDNQRGGTTLQRRRRNKSWLDSNTRSLSFIFHQGNSPTDPTFLSRIVAVLQDSHYSSCTSERKNAWNWMFSYICVSTFMFKMHKLCVWHYKVLKTPITTRQERWPDWITLQCQRSLD